MRCRCAPPTPWATAAWSDSGVGTTALIATGGICSRTEAVRNTFLTKISDISDCADVTSTHLATIASFIFLRPQDITALAAGDFDGLTSLTSLTLGDNMLSTLPAEVFDDLTSLMTLSLRENRLSTLPAGMFDGLTSLMTLQLQNNMLSTLPAGVFNVLILLTRLNLGGNPGASFAPEAVALPDDGRVLYTGGTVRLDGSFTDGGAVGRECDLVLGADRSEERGDGEV